MHPLAMVFVTLLLSGCDTGEDDTAPESDADTDADADTDTDVDTGPADADGDGWTVADGDCDDANPSVHPGVVEDCENGRDDDCDGTSEPCGFWGDLDPSIADATLAGAGDEGFAGATLATGDIDGDGLADVLVGAFVRSSGGVVPDRVHVVRGPVSGIVDLSLSDATLSVEGTEFLDPADRSLAMGDVDSDGYDDVLIGAAVDSAGGEHAGAVYLVRGPVSGELDMSSAEATLVGAGVGGRAGITVATGDIDGDGRKDIVVGSHADAAYLVSGPVSGTMGLAAADAILASAEAGDRAGDSVATGDVDGDGIADVVVGAPYAGEHGAAYLVLGPVTGVVDLSAADATLVGQPGDDAGIGVSTADTDGDGLQDLVVVADPGASARDDAFPVAYLVRGPISGRMSLSKADGQLVVEERWTYGGWLVVGGDVDADGRDDLLVGGWDAVAYLFHGPISGTEYLWLADASSPWTEDRMTGWDVALGDVDGDGADDVIASDIWDSTGGEQAGAVFLFYGVGW